MTRLGSLMLCITLGTGLPACGNGGTSKTALDLVPIDNDVSGWTVDEAHSKSPGERAMVANSHTEAVNLIDGTAADYDTDMNSGGLKPSTKLTILKIGVSF